MIPRESAREWLPSAVAWRMAPVDPARARRLVDESQQDFEHPQAYLFLALGLKSRDPEAAQAAFQIAMEKIDQLMKDGVEYSDMLKSPPGLASDGRADRPGARARVLLEDRRHPTFNRRSAVRQRIILAVPILLLAWYDRDVAAALFEPVRDQMEQMDEPALADASLEFLSWSLFDPRAAVARLERLPVSRKARP